MTKNKKYEPTIDEAIDASLADLDQEQQEHMGVVWPSGGMMTMGEIISKQNHFRHRFERLMECKQALRLLRQEGFL